MPTKPVHFPEDERSFRTGANLDAEGEIVARDQGAWRDAQNMRPADNAGGNGGLVKIGGEELLTSPVVPGAATYMTLGSISVGGRKFSIHASSLPNTYAPLAQLDGQVVVQSFLLPYKWGSKIKMHKAETPEGGLVFDCRSTGVPLVFDIGHILEQFQQGLQTYFADLDLSTLTVNQTAPQDRPRFYGLVDVGAGGGMKPGTVHYCLRYARQEGDVTALGPEIGQIFIPQYIMGSPGFQRAGIEGAVQSDIGNRTRYACRLKFRAINPANFERIELIAIDYNENLGPDALPKYRIAKRFALSPGQDTIIEYDDNGDGEEFIPPDEANLGVFYIKRAEAVRYINYRLVLANVELAALDIDIEFRELNGKYAVPFTKNLGVSGHADPVNNCYYRRFMGGERYGIAAVLRDSAGRKSYAVPLPSGNVQFPNRRDVKEAESLALSDAPVFAANTQTSATDRVTPSFEVFDHDNAVGRPNVDRIVNIMRDGRHRVAPNLNDPFNPFTGTTAENGVYLDQGMTKTAYIKPLRPVSPRDPDKFGHQYRVNDQAADDYTSTNPVGYDPKVFEVNNHTMGLAVMGLKNLPENIAGIEIVRTRPAKRVIAQALACWRLIDGQNGNPATKGTSEMFLLIPEVENGQMDEADLAILLERPQDVGLQMVSPLGLATEVFGGVFGMTAVSPLPARSQVAIADMMSYARVLWDAGQINPGAGPGGQQPPSGSAAPGANYVDFGNWRNGTSFGPWHQPGQDGNAILGLLAAQRIDMAAGGTAFEVTINTPVYATANAGVSRQLNNPQTKAFHEPWYVVNLVLEGRQPDSDPGYITTNTYIKTRGSIGRRDGQAQQDLELIDERPQDVWSDQIDDFRYIWVNGRARLLQSNITVNLQLILNDIANNGFWINSDGVAVYGLYEVVNQGSIWFVRVGVNSFINEGQTIEVRYNGKEIFVFGDCTSAPVALPIYNTRCRAERSGLQITFPPGSQEPYALSANQVIEQGTTARLNGLPVPFCNYKLNGRYYVPFGLGFPLDNDSRLAVNGVDRGGISTVRQWMALFDCELRSPILCLGLNESGYTFPAVHYIPRPYNYDPNLSPFDNGTHNNMDVEYPNDIDPVGWEVGGFRWKQLLLSDYAVQRTEGYVQIPEFGYQEQTVLRNAVIWSPKVSPTLQNRPGLRTFPRANIYFIEDDTGPIEFLWSAGQETGANSLYPITSGGTCQLLVERGIAYSADGQSFSLFAQDKFVGAELWPSKHVGMPRLSFRTAAEGGAQMPSAAVRQDTLFWSDGRTAYMLGPSGPPIDIAKGRFMRGVAAMQPSPFSKVGGAAVYDGAKDEYYMAPAGIPLVYAASAGLHFWVGKYTYEFDDYLYHNGRVFGYRGVDCFLLDEGYRIAGEEFDAWVKFSTALIPGSRMDWPYFRFNTWRKPIRVQFFDEKDQLKAYVDENWPPGNNGKYVKLIDGWGNFTPLGNPSLDPSRSKIQGRVMYVLVTFRGDDKDLITDAFVATKPINY